MAVRPGTLCTRPTTLISLPNNSQYNALVDTGAAVSVIPKRIFDKLPHNYKTLLDTTINPFLTSVTEVEIPVYGTITLNIAILALRRKFQHTFIIADIPNIIIGAEFLSTHNLIVDCRKSELIDTNTKLVAAVSKTSSHPAPNLSFPNSVPKEIQEALKEYMKVFGPPNYKNTASTEYEFPITTTGRPIAFKPRRLAPEKYNTAKAYFEELLEAGIIQPSSSPWASPLHMVKKQDGSWRPCGDYRALNNVTEKDSYPTPNPQDSNLHFKGCKVFSKLDLVKAYHAIPMEKRSIPKTAITTPFGLYEYIRMPFGLKNSASHFVRYVHSILRGLDKFTFAYFDDIIIASKSLEEHITHLETVFEKLNQAELRVNINKCEFAKSELSFLGYQLSAEGICPPKDRVEALTALPLPKNYKELRSRLGAINFYRRCLPGAAILLAPLQKLVTETQPKKGKYPQFNWTEEHTKSYKKLIDLLNERVVLAHPPTDCTELSLTTDASDKAISGVLEAEGRPIGFYSRKLTPNESAKSAFERELLALAASVMHFRLFVEALPTVAYTDHKPLLGALARKSEAKSRWQASRLATIAEHIKDIRYVPGESNLVADMLSRETLPVTIINESKAIDLNEIIKNQNEDIKINPSVYKELLKTEIGDEIIYIKQGDTYPRPYIPPKLRKFIIQEFHELGHSSIKTTSKMIRSRYFWPEANKDIQTFCRECLTCQKSKITKHTKFSTDFHLPSERLTTVHIDIVGPLPITPTCNKQYLLTMIDRVTNWIEAIPIFSPSAKETADAFLETWIARYGVPLHVITDQGRNFESELFNRLSKAVVFHRLRTTAYHPQTNGKIERAHRTMKQIMRCHIKDDWHRVLPYALLAMRMTPTYHGFSPFTALTGAKFANPIPVSDAESTDIKTIIQKLKQLDSSLMTNPTNSTTQANRTNIIPKELLTSSHVWLRIDRVKRPLEAPYTGPHKVIRRNTIQGTYVIEINGQERTVSINRLKPCNHSDKKEKQLHPSPDLRLIPIRHQPRAPSSSGYDTNSNEPSQDIRTPSRSTSPVNISTEDGKSHTENQILSQQKIMEKGTEPNVELKTDHLKIPQAYRESLYGKDFQKVPLLKDQFNINIDVEHIGRKHDLIGCNGPKNKVDNFIKHTKQTIQNIANSQTHNYNTRSKTVHFSTKE